jgi:hypothetical protein
MRVAFGLFGFIRMPVDNICQSFLNFFNKLPIDTEIDIYICCPETTYEFSNELLDVDNIKTQLHKICKNVHIKTFQYEPYRFIEKSKSLNYNFVSQHNIYTYRLLSMHSNMSELSKYILESPNIYDFIILTRYDMLSQINDLGNVNRFAEKNTIFSWRSSPYHSREHAEDRIIVTSRYGLEILSNLYDGHSKMVISDAEFYGEGILCKYLNLYEDLIKKDQGIDMMLSPFKDVKYSVEVKNKCLELLQNYNTRVGL